MTTTPEITIEEARLRLSHHESSRDSALDYSVPNPVTEQDFEYNDECHSQWVTHGSKAQYYQELIDSKIRSVVDDYLLFLSESTTFDEEGRISKTEHEDYAKRLREAAIDCGAFYGDSIQVCASNCGFYRFEFIKDPLGGPFVTVTTYEFTPEY